MRQSHLVGGRHHNAADSLRLDVRFQSIQRSLVHSYESAARVIQVGDKSRCNRNGYRTQRQRQPEAALQRQASGEYCEKPSRLAEFYRKQVIGKPLTFRLRQGGGPYIPSCRQLAQNERPCFFEPDPLLLGQCIWCYVDPSDCGGVPAPIQYLCLRCIKPHRDTQRTRGR
jgi:hypothetical protein